MSESDIEKYREEHESEEHWNLRRAFLLRWRNNYDEDRLLCLARVFINIELMGCRYPSEVMKEIAGLSEEVVKLYRDKRKNKLKRTFVSASDAAEDRAKGVKRQGGVIVDLPQSKNARIAFVPQGHSAANESRVTGNMEDIENVEEIQQNMTVDGIANQPVPIAAMKRKRKRNRGKKSTSSNLMESEIQSDLDINSNKVTCNTQPIVNTQKEADIELPTNKDMTINLPLNTDTVPLKSTKSALKVVIKLQPSYNLTPEESDQVIREINQRIENDALKSLNPGETRCAPAFRGKPFLSNGVIKMWCENEHSLKWLQSVIGEIASPVENRTLSIAKQSEMENLVKVGLFLPNAKAQTKKELIITQHLLIEISDTEEEHEPTTSNEQVPTESLSQSNQLTSGVQDNHDYLKELNQTACLDVRYFRESMFNTRFGMLVLMIKPWMNRMDNIFGSCSTCKLERHVTYEEGMYSLYISQAMVAQAVAGSKAEARAIVEAMAWDRLRRHCVNVYVREQWIAQGDSKISNSDVSHNGGKLQSQLEFGTPIESSVATKMMKLMGWAGGGLGADAQGIEEPVKPHLQMVNRAGLGSDSSGRHFHQAATELMRRYSSQDTLDVDLVFSSCFSKEERAKLHQIAKRSGLASHSYGKDYDRFLVVKKKTKDPFDLVRDIIDKGGNTAKYQIFIPNTITNK